MRIDSHGKRKWILPLGLSILVNGILLVSAVKILSTLPSNEDTTIAVELTPANPPKLITTSVPHKVQESKPVEQPANKSLFNSFKSLFQPQPKPVVEQHPITRPQPSAPVRPISPTRTPVVEPSHPNTGGSEGGHSGGTSATGPGEYTGSGSGGGTGGGTGSGSGTGSGTGTGSGSGHGTGTGSGTGEGHGTPMVQPPAPPPQPTPPPPPLKEDPKPKGETRGPQITRQSKPAYPPDAKDDGVEGTVVLLLTIDRSGDVSRVKMENGSGDKRLDKAAEQTVRQWAYSPSLRDGEPVEATIRVRVQFRIE